MEKNKDKKRKQFVGSSSFSEEDDATPPTTQQKNRKKLCLLSHGVREKKYQKSWEETYKWIEESSKGTVRNPYFQTSVFNHAWKTIDQLTISLNLTNFTNIAISR